MLFCVSVKCWGVCPKPRHKGLFVKSPLESQKLHRNKVMCFEGNSLAYLSYKKGKLFFLPCYYVSYSGSFTFREGNFESIVFFYKQYRLIVCYTLPVIVVVGAEEIPPGIAVYNAFFDFLDGDIDFICRILFDKSVLGKKPAVSCHCFCLCGACRDKSVLFHIYKSI